MAALALAMAPALAAAGGTNGMDGSLASAFSRLDMTEGDVGLVFDHTWDVDDPTLFRFADALDEPTIDPTSNGWTVPQRIGLAIANWPEDPEIPTSTQVTEGALWVPTGEGLLPGVDYALIWAQMGGEVPIEPPMNLFQNWSFPISTPGAAVWEPIDQFPNDTWGNASVIPNLTYGPNPHDFQLFNVLPDGTLTTIPVNGFGLITGDMIIVGVDAATVFPDGVDGAAYGFAGHVHDGGFGADPSSQSIVSYATGLPGTLAQIAPLTVIEVGSTPPPTTTTTSTTTTSTTTTTVPETTTTLAQTAPPPDDETGGGVPLLAWILGALGIVAIVIGGRLFFAPAKDPCTDYLLAWETAQKECDEARARAKKAREDCDKARQELANLKKRRKDICAKWPPACRSGEDAWIEESGKPGSRITSTDLHARRVALGRLWDDYQEGKASAQDVQDAWEKADTPEFREQLRQKTEAKRAELQQIDKDLETKEAAAKKLCDAASAAEREAEAACAKAKEAKYRYDECVKEQAAEDFVDAFMGLGSDGEEAEEPTEPVEQPPASTPPPPAEPVDPFAGRLINQPVPFVLDKTGLEGAELERAEKLEDIFSRYRGTGDIASVAEALWIFNNWHLETFDEPWLEWSTDGGDPQSATVTSGRTDTFMQTRKLACYEFVHFCAYIASDQLGTQRVSSDEDNPQLLDEYSVRWGFTDRHVTNQIPLTGEAPRGSVITGSFRWGSYDNSAGYYHTGVSIGDGKIISLGSDGLILEDATGAVDACFPSIGYENIQYGDYKYGQHNPAPK